MKKIIPFSAGVALVILMAILPGCQKFVDVKDLWHQHNPDCRIEKIFHTLGNTDTVAYIEYNAKGNPVLIYGGIYPPEVRFLYDRHDRLTTILTVFPNGAYIRWHHFGHDFRGRVILDTLDGFGRLVDGKPQDGLFQDISELKYDAFDRIIEEKITHTRGTNNPVSTFTYTYNADGNRLAPDYLPEIQYDDKVSVYRTHPIWMLITRNYSRNNTKRAIAYNRFGLPLAFELASNEYAPLNFIGDIDLGDAQIVYKCK